MKQEDTKRLLEALNNIDVAVGLIYNAGNPIFIRATAMAAIKNITQDIRTRVEKLSDPHSELF